MDEQLFKTKKKDIGYLLCCIHGSLYYIVMYKLLVNLRTSVSVPDMSMMDCCLQLLYLSLIYQWWTVVYNFCICPWYVNDGLLSTTPVSVPDMSMMNCCLQLLYLSLICQWWTVVYNSCVCPCYFNDGLLSTTPVSSPDMSVLSQMEEFRWKKPIWKIPDWRRPHWKSS